MNYNLSRLRDFVIDFGRLIERNPTESVIFTEGAVLLAALVERDDWLPPEYAEPDPDRYQQYLLHCDSRERFSVVSFVWGPNQATPIHDHRVWGLIGMLRGSETGERWSRGKDGRILADGSPQRLEPGDIDRVSPRIGDIHRVANALADRVSISIHVYGANIGRVERSIYDESGNVRPFISGYANKHCPNIWGK
ncbi:cysteine dioxygenase [Sphingobium fluviale]|uniref:Cysteine dioxygenase n=1 Tax=Sphingobium fluviale TaxID=2506423 RepID=A0A4Q1KH43_9SPHN|nr:cysteine dioxygenase [Sphingobium fluviale]RXR28429.1 cysteine dioxygenase [Sphingobium fluviale]